MERNVLDFVVDVHGSIILLLARSDAARLWCEEHLPEDRQRWGRDGTVVEPRYIGDIVEGFSAEGYTYVVHGAV